MMTKGERDARQRLGDTVRRIALAHFYEEGAAALHALRETDPATYARIAAENPWMPGLCAAIVARRARTAH